MFHLLHPANNTHSSAARSGAERLAHSTVRMSHTQQASICYVPFSGKPEDYHRWSGLFFSIMDEQGLGEVMSGIEKAPGAPASCTEADAAAFAKAARDFQRNNGKLYTRLALAIRPRAQKDSRVRRHM